MHISGFSIVFMVISAIISIGVPVFLFLFFRKRYNAKTIPMIFGIAGFIIFALIIEGSIHRIILGKFALKEKPLAYIIYGIFMAGIFEETARFISFNILKRKYKDIGTGLSYGIGHGGIESILLAGVSMIIGAVSSIIINTGNVEIITSKFQGEALAVINSQIENLSTSAPYLFLIGGAERLFAIAIQLSLSVIVFYAVYKKKLWLFPLAILAHAIIDIPAASMQAGVLKNVFLVEGFVCVFAIAVTLFAKYLYRKYQDQQTCSKTSTLSNTDNEIKI
jgi:uncharacterized membrane protein YhfC